MTGRILRIELRRSAAFWALAISIPFGFLWSSVAEGMSGVMGEQRGALGTLIPLAVGVGAWQARRDRRSRTSELLATTVRPPWQRLLATAAALGIGALTGYFLVSAGLTIYALAVGAYAPMVLLASAVVTALWLVAAFWLGLGIGRMLPFAMVPPLLVVAGFVALVWVFLLTDTEGYGDRPPPGIVLLDPTSSTGFDAFEALTSRALLAQVLWVVAFAAACLVLYVASRRFRLAAVVLIALGGAVAGSLLPSSLHDAITLDRGALALVCARDEPRVCARRMHPRVVQDLREPGREALTILAAKLPQAPSTVVEAYYGNDSPVDLESRADTVYAEFSTDGNGRLEASEVDILWTLLMGAGTSVCQDDRSPAEWERYLAARLVAAAWLLEQEPLAPSDPDGFWGGLPSTAVTRPAYDALLALPADEQRARVAELREAELTCGQRDRLDILTGSGSPA